MLQSNLYIAFSWFSRKEYCMEILFFVIHREMSGSVKSNNHGDRLADIAEHCDKLYPWGRYDYVKDLKMYLL